MKKLILYASVSLTLLSCRVGTVDPGVIYRSPQLDKAEFQQVIDEKGIKTIINLRGENPGEKWYKDEKEVAEKNGVTLINISMSARKIPHQSRLIKLLDALRDAPKPILIHCKAGVDRTGEASALYQMIHMQYPKKKALEMLSLKWAHSEKFMPAKKYFVRDLWKGEEWARNVYSPCTENYKFYDKNNSECQPQQDVEEVLSAEDDT